MQVSGCVCTVNVHAVHASVYMASLTTISMAESSGGGPGSPTPGQPANIQQAACIFCTAPLPHPSAPFCTHCSNPQKFKKCINSQCQTPIPPAAPMCCYCGTLQQSQQQGAAKKCINPQCGAPLLPKAMYCTTCGAPQDPVRFQQLMSAAHCISCSAQLLIPGQKICHNCGSTQSTQTSMGHSGQQPLPNLPHVPQAIPNPNTFQPPPPPPASPSSHIPQATSNPNTFQPPPPPPPASPSHIPQAATPHPHSQTGLTVQQQVFSATKHSPDSETFNSTRKRSRTEVKLVQINLCALVRMLRRYVCSWTKCWRVYYRLSLVVSMAYRDPWLFWIKALLTVYGVICSPWTLLWYIPDSPVDKSALDKYSSILKIGFRQQLCTGKNTVIALWAASSLAGHINFSTYLVMQICLYGHV